MIKSYVANDRLSGQYQVILKSLTLGVWKGLCVGYAVALSQVPIIVDAYCYQSLPK